VLPLSVDTMDGLHAGAFRADQQAANLAATVNASAASLGLQNAHIAGVTGTPDLVNARSREQEH
jgi:hypothetical protein